MPIGIEELIGKSVIGAAGNYVGEVSNIEIDPSNWQITHLHINLSEKAAKEFCIKKSLLKRANIRLSTAVINNVDVIIRLNKFIRELKNGLCKRSGEILIV
jgi:sporulation protein YlmC with PRC-barrel domain